MREKELAMGTKTEKINATATETTPARPKVKRYRIKKQFAADMRGAFRQGQVAVKIYGSNFDRAYNTFYHDNLWLSIGFGSSNPNPYMDWRLEMFKRGYKKALALLSPEQIAKINEQHRRVRLSPESRRLEDVKAEVSKLTEQVERMNAQLAERGLVEADA